MQHTLTRHGAEVPAHLIAFNRKPTTPKKSSIFRLFEYFNQALALAAEAERDLNHGDGSDPAIDHWLVEAEACWRHVDDIQAAIETAPVLDAADRIMQQTARNARRMMHAETVLEFWAAYDSLRFQAFLQNRTFFALMPDHLAPMLNEFTARLNEIASLELFHPVSAAENLPCELQELFSAAA